MLARIRIDDYIRGMRECRACKKMLDESAFPDSAAIYKGKNYKRRVCAVCFKEQRQAQLPARNVRRKVRYSGLSRTERYSRLLHARFGLTLAEAHALGTCCAICGGSDRRLVVDHDHRTNTVRGMLCDMCNLALGGFLDSPDILRRAATYLERV